LDEQRRVLQLLVPKKSGQIGDLRVFYEMPEREALDCGEALEHHIGVALLSFLSATYQSSAFRLDEYRDAAKTITPEWEAERGQILSSKSAAGDPAAKYELAMHRVAEGLRTKSRAIMNEADALLREAASLGSSDADKYLSNLWPALKLRSDRAFKE
jgi:hypothetical protein